MPRSMTWIAVLTVVVVSILVCVALFLIAWSGR